MGMDITMHIVKDGKFIKKDIFQRRDNVWFDNISQTFISDMEYENLPVEFDVREDFPQEWKDIKNNALGYFNFRYFTVRDFKEWCIKYKPELKAGWVSKYTYFLIDKKDYLPCDHEIKTYLEEDDIIEDMVWVEYQDPFDSSYWLLKYLVDNFIDDDAYIVYCFDR